MRTLSLLAFLFLLFTTCEKNTDPAAIWAYMPLEPGSYWTYETFLVDTNGVEEPISEDTLWLESLEIVGQHRMASFESTGNFVFEGTIPSFDLQAMNERLLSSDGTVHLSELLELDGELVQRHILDNDLGHLDTRLITEPVRIDVPYGSFDCIGNSRTVELTDTTHFSHQRVMYRYYGQGIGIVKATSFFLNSPKTIETRLTGYYHQ